MANTPIEAGLRRSRTHFVRETTRGEAPTDPDWLLYSDTVEDFTVTPQAGIYMRRGIGSPLVQGFHGGTETHPLVVGYLQQKFLVDGAGAGDGAGADGFLRDADNRLANSHSVLQRIDISAGGANGGGRRIYTVAHGAVVGTAQLSGTPGTGQPNMERLEYQCESVRSYVIEQPDAPTVLKVESTSDEDVTQEITIEDEGAGNSETLALNGTTEVTGSTQFDDIDALYLDGECKGDVIVKIGNTEIARIYGSESYQNRGGDRGVPLLGSGTFETDLMDLDFQAFVGSQFERPLGTDIGDNVMGIEVNVNNNLESKPRATSPRPIIYEGDVDVQLTANIFGEQDTHDKIMQHLRIVENNFRWTLTDPKLAVDVSGAIVSAPGARQLQPSQAVMERGVQFTGQELTAEILAPLFASAAVDGASLTVTFDDALDVVQVPAAGAFDVQVAGSARTVSSVAIAGSVVTLTLSSAVTSSQAVTVAYDKPSANPLQSSRVVEVESFTAETVTNNT